MFRVEDVKWLDDKGHVRPPLWLYLVLLFLARGWAIFVMSLTMAEDRAGLVRLFYPEKQDFLVALAAGSGALLVFGLILAERRRTPQWLSGLFRCIRGLLATILLIDGALLLARLQHAGYLFEWPMALDGLLLFWSMLYLWRSRHLRGYVADWH